MWLVRTSGKEQRMTGAIIGQKHDRNSGHEELSAASIKGN
jgi:hypothetical protein